MVFGFWSRFVDFLFEICMSLPSSPLRAIFFDPPSMAMMGEIESNINVDFLFEKFVVGKERRNRKCDIHTRENN